MNALNVAPTEFSPKIILDEVSSKFEVSGESRPENANKFFAPVIAWLEQYQLVLYWEKQKFGKTRKIVFEFNLGYFNSTSAKFILDILNLLDKFFQEGYDIKVVWHYDVRDEDMMDSGEEFSKLVKMPFECKSY